MKVISLLQPWASLVVLGHKKIETRSWNTKHRGELLIHASKKFDERLKSICCMKPFRQILIEEGLLNVDNCPVKFSLPTGAIIGKVKLEQTFRSEGLHEIISTNAEHWDVRSIKEFDSKYEQELALGDYSPGRYGWLLSDPVPFKEPIPAKGKLSIWDFDTEGMQL